MGRDGRNRRRHKMRDEHRQMKDAALTIFLWNRRLRMRWWFDNQHRRKTAATTILLWNRRLRLKWWFNAHPTVCNNREPFDIDSLNNIGNGVIYDNGMVYNNNWSHLPNQHPTRQQCRNIARVARVSFYDTTLDNNTAAIQQRHKPCR